MDSTRERNLMKWFDEWWNIDVTLSRQKGKKKQQNLEKKWEDYRREVREGVYCNWNQPVGSLHVNKGVVSVIRLKLQEFKSV